MGTLGVDVVDDAPRRLEYPDLGLAVLAVPHAALLGARRSGEWRPDARARHNVLVTHPEVEGLFPTEATDYGGARVALAELVAGGFDYVALGHYHIVTEVAPLVWYSGSLEYTSPNIWGESRQEAHDRKTKGFLVADLEQRRVEHVPLKPERRILDLKPLDASGMLAADLDAGIARSLADIRGGLDGAVVRLVVENVPRALAHALDHEALRAFRAAALHLNLDLRRPEPPRRVVGVGGPGGSRTLGDVLADYLSRRPLDADLDRERLVALGRGFLDEVDRALLEGEGAGGGEAG
jgi:exonuclease SbcD